MKIGNKTLLKRPLQKIQSAIRTMSSRIFARLYTLKSEVKSKHYEVNL